jgi:hypothetical protein
MMSLEAFKESAKGAKLAALLSSDDAIARMIRKSEASRPAVEAIGREVEARVGALDDDEKKLVGRWVRQVLEPKGWTPDRKGRVAAGNFFSRGTIYRRIRPRHSRGEGPDRLAAAQALVARLSAPPMSSDELIADRRRAAAAQQ